MVTVRVVDVLQVVEVDHHQREPALVPFRGRDGAIDRPLELRAVGQPGEEVGAGLLGVLAGPVEGHRDLVRHRCDEREVARLECAGEPRRYGHRAQQHSLRSELSSDRAPFARDAVDSGLGGT